VLDEIGQNGKLLPSGRASQRKEHASNDTRTGKRTKAIDYIASGGDVRGMEFIPTADGVEVQTMAGTGVG
jgi:hypothetical protein